MPTMRTILPRLLLLALAASPLSAHDFWIEPSSFTAAPGMDTALRLRVGEALVGDALPRRSARLAEFYVLACAVGLVQGGVFSLSRSYFARLIPAGDSAQFFGFYNTIGKFAAVLGPFLVAGTAAWTGSTRAAAGAILPLLVLGGLLLAFVDPERGVCRGVIGATHGAPHVIEDATELLRRFESALAMEHVRAAGLDGDGYEAHIHVSALKRAAARLPA